MGQTESSSCSSRNCRPCSSSDQTTDTVKINQAALAKSDKENATPNTVNSQEQEDEKAKRLRADAERRAEIERREREERQRLELEQRRIEEERLRRAEEERQRAAIEEQQRAAKKQEEERRLAQEAAAQREREEIARREQEARDEETHRQEAERVEQARRAKEASDKKAVEDFLSGNGFTDVNYRRSKMMKKCHPLHEAVQQNNAAMVQLLLAAKADPALKSSANQTPLQLAQKSNRNGSHATIEEALSV